MLPRLKTAEQFAAVLDASRQGRASGAGVWRSEHFVLHMAPLAVLQASLETTGVATLAQHSKPKIATIGVICPKRWAKRAVTRNTIKRQIYAVSSALSSQLPSACLVLRMTHGFSSEAFPSAKSSALKSAVRQEIQALLSRLTLLEHAQRPS